MPMIHTKAITTNTMNKLKLKVHDSDRHVIEPESVWTDYVDPDIYKQCPVYLKYDSASAQQERSERLGRDAAIELPPQYMLGQSPLMDNWSEALQIISAHKNSESQDQRYSAITGHSQLQSMDEGGIDVASIFPTFTSLIMNHSEVSSNVAMAYSQAYNQWLNDYCSDNPDRLKAVGLISRQDPKKMLEQLESIVAYGWHCITFRPEMIAGRTLGHIDYEEFWQACEHYNVSIAIHGSSHLHGQTAGTERFTSRFSLHACSHPIEAQKAFLSLLDAGVLQRFPKLKFAFLEAGASWLPHWLWRLDNICFPEYRELTQNNIKILPSEYFKRQCWVAIELDEPCLRQTIEAVGSDCLLFGTDYPHPDHLRFDKDDLASSCSELSEPELKKLLVENPQHFFSA